MTTVRVYSKPNCTQCTMTKNLLDALEVPYVLEDILEPENLAAVKELGFLAAPVVAVGLSADDMWSGFQPDRIKEIAKRIEQENAA